MVPQIIAFDLDGTLTESRQPIGPDMAKVLHRLCEKSKIAVISGGSFKRFEKQLLPYISGSECFILLPVSGSVRYEFSAQNKEWEKVYEAPMDANLKEQVKQAITEIVASLEFNIPPNPTGEYVEDKGGQITFAALGLLASLEAKKSWDPDKSKRKKIEQELLRRVEGIDAFVGGLTSVDVLPKGTNKATGLKRLAQDMNIELSNIAFFGDAVFPGGNDYSVYEAGIETYAVPEGPHQTLEILKKWL